MTDCADIYSFTLDGSRQDSFLKGFKLLTNAKYAQQSGPLFASNIYTNQTVNILTDPKAMDLRVPESMTNIRRVGITKKKKNEAEYKKNTKVISVDGEKEIVEDGKIKALRKKQKFVDAPEPPGRDPLDPWEKVIPPEFNVIYTLAGEMRQFESEFGLQQQFPTAKRLNKMFKSYLPDIEDSEIAKVLPMIQEISKIYKEKTDLARRLNKEQKSISEIPIELTEDEIINITAHIIGGELYSYQFGERDVEFGMTGEVEAVLNLLPPQEYNKVSAALDRYLIESIAEKIGSTPELVRAVGTRRALEIHEEEMTRQENIREERRRSQEMYRNFLTRGIPSSDDDYRNRTGLVFEGTTERTLRNLAQGERVVGSESQGGTTLAGPAFVPRIPEAAPRRPASYPRSVGPGGIAGEDYVPQP